MSKLTADSPSDHVCTRFAALREPGKTLRAAHEKWLILITVLLLGFGLAGASRADTVVVTADRMIDVVAGKVVEHPRITITDGRITAIGSAVDSQVALPDGARRIDLPGMTLLPGLIDMHTHITGDPRYSGYRGLEFTDNFWTVVGVANARKTVEAGFTTIRNVGSANFDDVAIKQGIEGGYVPGPRIVPATYAIGATGGHCDSTEFPPSVTVPAPAVADGPEAIRATVRKLRKYGAEVIKFCATGGVLSKTDTAGGQQYSLAEMKALVDEAHMLGLRVAVHAHGATGIKDAIRAGADTIEHCSFADAEAFALAKEHGTYFSMDIYNDDYILAEGGKNGTFKESLDKERLVGLKQRQTFQAAVKAGVKMIFGTDAGVYPNGDNARQFATMVKWGMTPMQAIQAATVTAAEALGRSADVGAISVGRFGDIIGVAGDPLADVTRLQSVAFVMKGGDVVKGAHESDKKAIVQVISDMQDAWNRGDFRSAESRGTLRFHDIQVEMLAPDAAQLVSQYELDRPEHPQYGINTRLMRKVEGHWVIALNHVSSSETPPL
jgi:imidazolonepropionase-like amidohydrolase